jgi:hypothetical protein
MFRQFKVVLGSYGWKISFSKARIAISVLCQPSSFRQYARWS